MQKRVQAKAAVRGGERGARAGRKRRRRSCLRPGRLREGFAVRVSQVESIVGSAFAPRALARADRETPRFDMSVYRCEEGGGVVECHMASHAGRHRATILRLREATQQGAGR